MEQKRFGAPADGPRDDRCVAFHQYKVFPKLRLLLRAGRKVDLGPRAFDVLWVLIEADGGLVSKDDLIWKVWADVAVEENNLQAQISSIRKALGTDRDMLATEFGRGYRLNAGPRSDSASPQAEYRPDAYAALPYPLTGLLGREDEQRDVARLTDEHRLVTIIGPGGIGKSRLAIEVARDLQAAFTDGVSFVDMARLVDGDQVASTIAASLGLVAGDLRSRASLDARLRGKRVLMLVDGGEHLLDAIARVLDELLKGHHGIHVLATSQEAFDLDGEYVFRLPPLPVPPPGAVTAGGVSAYPSVRLFLERASAAAHPFAFGDAVAGEVGALCRRLDGIPLALELAAARVPSLGVGGVLAGLSDRFNLLTAGRRRALPRHRTLRAAVDWSYGLLNAVEGQLLQRLSVFADSFDEEAVAYVAGFADGEGWRVLDLLRALCGKSLLQPVAAGDRARYRLLETIRHYAAERLAEEGGAAAVAQRHATFFAQAARRASHDWKTLPTGRWRRVHQANLSDIRAALDRAIAPEGSWRDGVDLLAHATPFWIERSLHDECQQRIRRVIDAAPPAALAAADELLLQTALGTSLSWARGPVPETCAAWERAHTLAGGLRDHEGEVQAHYGLWLYHLRAGDYSGSLASADALVRSGEAAGDRDAIAAGRRVAAVSQHFLGRHAEAVGLLRDVLGLMAAAPPAQAFRFGIDQRVAGLAFLARVLWMQGLSTEAVTTASQAVAEATALDHACSLCCALAEGLCMVQALDGDDEGVARSSAHLLRVAREHNLGFWRAYGDLFDLWAVVHRDPALALPGRIDGMIDVIDDIRFDASYSPLLIDIVVGLCRSGRRFASVERLGARLRRDARDEPHWARAELMRMRAHLEPCPLK